MCSMTLVQVRRLLGKSCRERREYKTVVTTAFFGVEQDHEADSCKRVLVGRARGLAYGATLATNALRKAL